MHSDKRGARNWHELTEKWRRSGKSQKEFCQEEGLSYWTFRVKAKEIRGKNEFVQIKDANAPHESDRIYSIEIRMGKICIRIAEGYDPKLLRSVITDLEEIWK